MIHFWELPGPYRFVTEIVDDLREGRNVFIFLPDNLPKGLFHIIQTLAKVDDLPIIEKISAPIISQSSPSYDLQLSLSLESEENFNSDISNLYQKESFKGRIIWVDKLWEMGEKANLWMHFFKQYSFICSKYDLLDRTLFIIPIKDKLIEQKIPIENLFTQHWYWGKLSKIDVQIYAAQLINDLIFEPLENQLAVNVISSVCGYEIDGIKKLCENWSGNSENISEILVNIGNDRNWTNKENESIVREIEKQNFAHRHYTDRPPTYFKKIWGKGMLNLFSGRIFINPIVNSLAYNSEEIRHRIWRGHAQTFLPIIDEYRIKIIGIIDEYGLINFDNDKSGYNIFEIGKIKYRIDSNRKLRRKIDRELLDLIRLLTKVRNKIAHLKIIPKQQREKLNRLIDKIF